ncbi:hypothetical protein [Rhizobium laguerreae]|nr:hypothetical protein [Rhizobium laguerreae]
MTNRKLDGCERSAHSVLGKDASPSYYPVRETIEEVVKQLTG